MKAKQKKPWHSVVIKKVRKEIGYLLDTSSAEALLFESHQAVAIELLLILSNSEIKPEAIADVKEQLKRLLRKTAGNSKMRVIYENLEHAANGI